jgi:nicotinate-nucleotide--dimethylbenzimidazole phosphoribosyltransferase
VSPAMTVEQAHAAMRAGMEIGSSLDGNALACAGFGVGGDIAAALVLSRLSGVPARELLTVSASADQAAFTKLLMLAQHAQMRHREVSDPIEVLAAFGGFDMAMLAGLMLAAAQDRRLIVIDGLTACAALMVASRVAPAVTDYCVFCRSRRHQGLDYAMSLFHASALLELGLDSIDGCGAALAWPLVRSAAALLTEVADGEDAGPTLPGTGFVSLGEGLPQRESSDDALLAAFDPSKPATAGSIER